MGTLEEPCQGRQGRAVAASIHLQTQWTKLYGGHGWGSSQGATLRPGALLGLVSRKACALVLPHAWAPCILAKPCLGRLLLDTWGRRRHTSGLARTEGHWTLPRVAAVSGPLPTALQLAQRLPQPAGWLWQLGGSSEWSLGDRTGPREHRGTSSRATQTEPAHQAL